MKKFNLKQKKIIAIILIIVVVIAYYYLYLKNSTEEISNQNLEINNTQESNQTNETKKETQETIIVHVSGAVNIEGIVELDSGSRIANAIEKAGGVKENADMTDINLAYPLEDGMKIHIPTKEETEAIKNNESTIAESYVTSSSGGINSEELTNSTQGNSASTTSRGKVNINTASQEELDALPGIGPSIASKIIDYREQNGKFNSIEEIKEVSGIGDAKYDKIKDSITVKWYIIYKKHLTNFIIHIKMLAKANNNK